jgi:hypothetical protein
MEDDQQSNTNMEDVAIDHNLSSKNLEESTEDQK